ncbi:MAG: DUF4249 domain-containing protein [Cyclobacteriaceae bacterium]
MKQSIVWLFAIATVACQKDIEIKPKSNYQESLFIEGILFPGEVPRIYVSRAVPFFDSEVTPQQVYARGAVVTLTHAGNNYTLAPDSTFDLFRCRWVPYYRGGIAAQQGETYTLSVTYKGQIVVASTTISQPKVNIEQIEYTPEFFDVYGGHDGVTIKLRDAPGAGNYYRFQMNRKIDNERLHAHTLDGLKSDCSNGEMYPITDLGRNIFSDENIDGQLMTMPVEVSFEYKEGDSTWIFMQSLDEKAARFYISLDRQLESILNPFVEPVFVETQLVGAIGVFGSAVRSDSVLFVYPQDNP